MIRNTYSRLLFAVVLAATTLVSCHYEKPLNADNKIDALLRIIEKKYVDTVDIADLIEQTLPKVLAELDPHSVYIPAKDVEETNQELKGSFSGIGIQFMIQSDTIYVSDVISGGPAEKVGLMAGDRIVTIDDSLYVGKAISNDGAMKRLKGPKGSEVRLGIKRHGEPELLTFTIVRGNIPVKSVDASYLIDDSWCYIKINKFGETTYPEMLISLAQGLQQGAEGVIIDLRGNTGGYMGAAIQMVNEFLPKGEMIVYTEGENSPRYEERANGGGSCQKLPIVVLTDETSASASEIFAGAIQDNDRGTIIGRRTFGKGLVQQPIEFADGSAIRLTIARYYTPSGRCIQKPYTNGKGEEYELDLLNRYEHGEFFTQDSIKQVEHSLPHQEWPHRLRWWRHHARHLRAPRHHRLHLILRCCSQASPLHAVPLRVHRPAPSAALGIHHHGGAPRLSPRCRPARGVRAVHLIQRASSVATTSSVSHAT